VDILGLEESLDSAFRKQTAKKQLLGCHTVDTRVMLRPDSALPYLPQKLQAALMPRIPRFTS
jgi:hypothetical protein